MPDIVALYSETRNLTPTLVWRPTESLPESVHEGVFTVDGGRGRFYASAWTESGYRYDPGCMTPADSRAREAAEFFEEARADAVEHRWETPGTLLLFDNRAVLHARAAVVENDGNREIRRVAFRRKEAFRR
ncbi:TauD/TfdA family dioxygenase [Rathayibacter sp. KR2-224]|uniref:TauD/TfdA family dioxygenase n=1 Tax=Rathayibacter sp. KR2-224 TaxID=3400913 RepID=UPI003C01332C